MQLSHSLFDHLESKCIATSIKLAVAYWKHFVLMCSMPAAGYINSKRCSSCGVKVDSSSFVRAFLRFPNLRKFVVILDFVRSEDGCNHYVFRCHLILFNPRML